jgi:hypothetical protein
MEAVSDICVGYFSELGIYSGILMSFQHGKKVPQGTSYRTNLIIFILLPEGILMQLYEFT